MPELSSRLPMELTSIANPRIKNLIGLRKKRNRDETRLTLAEGFEEITLAFNAGVMPESLYYCPDLASADQLYFADKAIRSGVNVFRLEKTVFDKVAYRESPDGWLAAMPSPDVELSQIRVNENSLFLICDGVEKPGNLGAMLRTADAAGVDAVIASQPVTDWGNPNIVRASKGTVFTIPVASADSADVLSWVGHHGISTVATTPHTERNFTDVAFSGCQAVVVGSEKYGLTPEWLNVATERARIPMVGQVNSLNVATSAAIVIYEAVRQRGINTPR